MPRWLWFTPFAFLTVALGLWGFRLGWIAATITETDVITTYAEQYVVARTNEGTEAARSDCVAYPGEENGIWIVIVCTPVANGTPTRYEFHVNRFGGLEHMGDAATRSTSGAAFSAPEI